MFLLKLQKKRKLITYNRIGLILSISWIMRKQEATNKLRLDMAGKILDDDDECKK